MNKGERFYRLTTLWECELRPVGRKNNWYEKCICDCWNIVWVNRYQLKKEWSKNRWVKSCWCWREETARQNYKKAQDSNRKHNMSNTRFYNIYMWILWRCNNPNEPMYKYYWWRGIKCHWKSFEEFMNDMLEWYNDTLTIDRIDVNWDYCKDNCRWATQKQQVNNTRRNVKYNWKWILLTIPEIIEKENLNIDNRIVWWRLKHWWDLDRAITRDTTLYHKGIK